MSAIRRDKLRISLNSNILTGLIVSGGFLGAVGSWAMTANLSGAVITSGFLVVEGNVKQVQHPVGGVIAELLVREGDRVQEGQPVARLDTTIIRANLNVATQGLNKLYARRARLEAELANASVVSVPTTLQSRLGINTLEDVMVSERRLFADRKAEREGEKTRLDNQMAQSREEITGLVQQIEAKETELKLIVREGDIQRGLLTKNLTQASIVSQIERYTARLQGEIGSVRAQIASTKGKIEEIALQKLQIDRGLNSGNLTELRDLETKEAELIEKEVTAKDALSRANICAPVSGIVHKLVVHTTGGVIRPAEALMEIVPETRSLVVEVRISPADIDQLHLAQPAHINFSAFNRSTTPEFNGHVERISADLETDEKTGISFYRTNITLNEGEVPKLKDLHLLPGMPAEVFIKTGDRKAWSWLVKPVMDRAEHTFREE